MTRQAKLEAIARYLISYEPGMTIAEYANKILDAVEENQKKGKKNGKQDS